MNLSTFQHSLLFSFVLASGHRPHTPLLPLFITQRSRLKASVARDPWSPPSMDGDPIHGSLHILIDSVFRLIEENPWLG